MNLKRLKELKSRILDYANKASGRDYAKAKAAAEKAKGKKGIKERIKTLDPFSLGPSSKYSSAMAKKAEARKQMMAARAKASKVGKVAGIAGAGAVAGTTSGYVAGKRKKKTEMSAHDRLIELARPFNPCKTCPHANKCNKAGKCLAKANREMEAKDEPLEFGRKKQIKKFLKMARQKGVDEDMVRVVPDEKFPKKQGWKKAKDIKKYRKLVDSYTEQGYSLKKKAKLRGPHAK